MLPWFVNHTADLGLQLGNDQACWVDVDQDGWDDLVVSGVVWRNDKGKHFTKIGDVGLAVAADYDNDGYPDFFSWSQMKVWHNVGGKSFTEAPLPPLPPTSSRGACWGDFNNDGLVDLYVGGFEDWDKQITYPSFLLMNQGAKGFVLTWSDATFRSRGVTACDFDQDGDADIYISNYRLQANELFVNDGYGHFKDLAAAFNAVATSPGFDGGHSIGAAWGDFDNDGRFDLFAGNFAHVDDRGDQPKSRFLLNRGKTFEDKGTCGVFYQESYASPAAADFDNDGALDLYFTTVYPVASFGKENHPVLYKNGGAMAFTDATEPAGLAKLGATYQAAWGDFNHDGRIDLVTAGALYENLSASGSWLEVRLQGDGKRVNRSAIGAQVRIKLKDRVVARQVEAGTGEGNQNSLTLHFGLGTQSKPVDLEVLWPGGRRQMVRGVKLGRIVEIHC